MVERVIHRLMIYICVTLLILYLIQSNRSAYKISGMPSFQKQQI